MFSAIVFESNSGYTAQYAKLLADRLKVPAYKLSDAPEKLDSVFFMGWVRAGSIVGLKKAVARYQVVGACAVGMSAPGNKQVESIAQRAGISGKVFYLQGGFDIKKLSGFNKLAMKVLTSIMSRSIAKKPNKTSEEAEMLRIATEGGSRVNAKNLRPIVDWATGGA